MKPRLRMLRCERGCPVTPSCAVGYRVNSRFESMVLNVAGYTAAQYTLTPEREVTAAQ